MNWLVILAVTVLSVSVSSARTSGDRYFNANYEIPLSEQEQAEFGHLNAFALSEYRVSVINGAETLRFLLPVRLTGGHEVPVEMDVIAHVGQQRWLSGARGKGLCLGPWVDMECRFEFTPLGLEDADLVRDVRSHFGQTVEADAVLRMARLFNGDPIGIVRTEGER